MARPSEQAWLLDKAGKKPGPKPKRRRTAGERAKPRDADSAKQWLAVPGVDDKPGSTAAKSESNGSSAAKRKTPRNGPRERRRLEGRLRRANADLSARDRTIAALQARVEELEAEVRAVNEGAPAATRPKPSGRSPKSKSARGLNQISFEELREIGLSVTQSARLIAARETRDGFASVDELDELPGFSRETIAELRKAFTKSGRARAR